MHVSHCKKTRNYTASQTTDFVRQSTAPIPHLYCTQFTNCAPSKPSLQEPLFTSLTAAEVLKMASQQYGDASKLQRHNGTIAQSPKVPMSVRVRSVLLPCTHDVCCCVEFADLSSCLWFFLRCRLFSGWFAGCRLGSVCGFVWRLSVSLYCLLSFCRLPRSIPSIVPWCVSRLLFWTLARVVR